MLRKEPSRPMPAAFNRSRKRLMFVPIALKATRKGRGRLMMIRMLMAICFLVLLPIVQYCRALHWFHIL